MKTCFSCKEVKSVSEFVKSGRSKDGYRSTCKLCYREYMRRRRLVEATTAGDLGAVVEWRDIPGYAGLYKAGSGGQILGVSRMYAGERVLKQHLNKRGYPQVCLSRGDGKSTLFVHALVALAFIGPRPEGFDVDHISGEKTDNRVENLRYLPRLLNQKLGLRDQRGEKMYNSRLNEQAVRVIRWAHRRGIADQARLARLHGVNRSTVTSVVSGRTWAHVQ